MSDSFLSASEIDRLQTQGLSRKTPYLIRGVTQTQLSVARHYGGCTYNGESYYYLPETDELIRDDVLKLVMRLRKAKKEEPRENQVQLDLLGEQGKAGE